MNLIAENPQQLSPEDRKLHALWAALPEGGAVSEWDAWELFQRVADREGDGAWSGAMLLTLISMGAVREIEPGAFVRADEFPIVEEDTGPGSPAHDRHIERLAQRERDFHERENLAAQRVYRESPAYRERQEQLAEIDEHARKVASEFADELRAEFEARLARLESVKAETPAAKPKGVRARFADALAPRPRVRAKAGPDEVRVVAADEVDPELAAWADAHEGASG